jgi:hypothetical protein
LILLNYSKKFSPKMQALPTCSRYIGATDAPSRIEKSYRACMATRLFDKKKKIR